jgi:endonuclease/exonuclease/phosphatase family metal-dependent hydrolase
VCTLINTNTLNVEDMEAWTFNVGGQRVCLGVLCQEKNGSEKVMVFNTHLTFPHVHDEGRRMAQAEKLRAIILGEVSQRRCKAIAAGDLNGDVNDQAIKALFRKEVSLVYK